MAKKACFYIDDVIWTLRDLTRQRPASIFDQHLLKGLKTAHDLYGAKFQMNLFYRTDFYYGNDEFTLADITDAYREEFTAASDWLKFSLHSKQEFPDYPFVNITYEDAKAIFNMIRNEVFRFAGENSFTYGITPHWGPISKAGALAFRDCGMKVLWASSGDKVPYTGDPNTLLYGHAGRLLHNRQPETMLFTRISRAANIVHSICGYNHISQEEEQAIRGTLKTVYDEETGIRLKVYCDGNHVINLLKDDDIADAITPFLNDEFLCLATHEQYSFPHYLYYQPTHTDRIVRVCELIADAGYTFGHLEDLAG